MTTPTTAAALLCLATIVGLCTAQLSIAGGGTNSGTALADGKLMHSAGGAIVEGTSDTTPAFASATLTATTNQLALGTTRLTTLSAPTPATAQTVTIPDMSAVLGTTSKVVLVKSTASPFIASGTVTAFMRRAGGAGFFTASTKLISYTMVSDTLFISIHIVWTANPGTTDQVEIPLPATVANIAGYAALFNVGLAANVTVPANSFPSGVAVANSGNLLLYSSTSGGAIAPIVCTDLGATGIIHLSGFFRQV